MIPHHIHVYVLLLNDNRCYYWGRQSCRPLNRVPSLPSLMVLRLTPRYVALWVENPFSRTSARTTYRLGEANFHTSLEEEGIFSRHVVLISIIVYLSCNTYNIICFFIHYVYICTIQVYHIRPNRHWITCSSVFMELICTLISPRRLRFENWGECYRNRPIDRADLADDVTENNEAAKFEALSLLSLRNCRDRFAGTLRSFRLAAC